MRSVGHPINTLTICWYPELYARPLSYMLTPTQQFADPNISGALIDGGVCLLEILNSTQEMMAGRADGGTNVYGDEQAGRGGAHSSYPLTGIELYARGGRAICSTEAGSYMLRGP